MRIDVKSVKIANLKTVELVSMEIILDVLFVCLAISISLENALNAISLVKTVNLMQELNLQVL